MILQPASKDDNGVSKFQNVIKKIILTTASIYRSWRLGWAVCGAGLIPAEGQMFAIFLSGFWYM